MTGIVPKDFLDKITPCGGVIIYKWPAEPDSKVCSVCWQQKCALDTIDKVIENEKKLKLTSQYKGQKIEP